jgi:hypothetical protein
MNLPLDLRFKLLAIAQQMSVTDAQGQLVYYVKQKAFKLKEAVTVFADESQTRPLYTITADRVLDISARYRITDPGGVEVGVLERRGMRSLWRAHYSIFQAERQVFTIREESVWVRVLDGIFGDIPILGLLAGYLFHPAYLVSRGEGQQTLLRAVKRPAFFEGRFQIEAITALENAETQLAVLGILMMLLLERARG